MRQMTGTITVAQEGRFRLSTRDGRSTLFVLSRHAPLGPQDLPPLVIAGLLVTVHYEPAGDVIASIACGLTLPDHRETASRLARASR